MNENREPLPGCDDNETGFFSDQKFFDHHTPTGLAERCAGQHIGQRVVRCLDILGDVARFQVEPRGKRVARMPLAEEPLDPGHI